MVDVPKEEKRFMKILLDNKIEVHKGYNTDYKAEITTEEGFLAAAKKSRIVYHSDLSDAVARMREVIDKEEYRTYANGYLIKTIVERE